MTQEEMRLALVNSTVKVVANDGLDKTTTKAISTVADLNEVYIYRLFEGKEDLLRKSFEMLDKELTDAVYSALPVMYNNEQDFVSNCRILFCTVWHFLLGNRDKCVCYMRYFYSPYFTKYSADTHEKRFAPLVAKFKDAFLDEADVWMILNHILNVMLDFAVKVHNGQMSSSDDYSEHVFRVIYASVKQYFRNPKESDPQT